MIEVVSVSGKLSCKPRTFRPGTRHRNSALHCMRGARRSHGVRRAHETHVLIPGEAEARQAPHGPHKRAQAP